jgi:uncharacterized protein (TIGR02646 family)
LAKAAKLKMQALREGSRHVVDDHYRDDDVRMALETLFHGKCAYCETKLTEGWNVDHHRPKKRVKERPDHPGYYWLAYEWTNLYPACNGCNQHLRDRPHWDANQQNDRAAGKADQFPLDDERHRAMSPTDDIARELPYVLDPCDDEPQLYLTFDIQGNVLAIDDDVFGETTIDVCHLDRYRLSLARAKVIETVVEMLGARELAARAGWAEAVDSMDRMLEAACASTAPHAAVARAVRNDPEAFGAPAPNKPLKRRRA